MMLRIKFILLFTLFLSLPFQGYSLKQIKALFDYKVLYAPGNGTYIETYLHFSAPTLKYVDVVGGIRSNIGVTLVLRQGDKIVDYKKYEIASPIVTDSILEDLYDVKQFLVQPGEYELEIELKDLNRKQSKPVSGFQGIQVEDLKKGGISDISFIEFANKTDNKEDQFYKSGYQLIPYISTYFSNDMDVMIFYCEGYNIKEKIEGDKFILNTYIEDYSSGKKIPNKISVKRKTTSEVLPVLHHYDIKDLPTGDYNIVVQIIDMKGDTVLSQSKYFERYKKTDELMDYVEIENLYQFDIQGDSIRYYVESLTPICGRAEQANIYNMVKEGDTVKLKKFMAYFWNKTEPLEPSKAWRAYKKQVDIVEGYYGTKIKFGFQSDRGRVYLMYGAPNDLIERPNEPAAYPYEVWKYDKIKKQSQRKFIFYNPDLVTNDYSLLHSDLIGELQNYRWKHELLKRNSPVSNYDDPADGTIQHMGSYVFDWE